MSLAHLLDASPVIQARAFAALAAPTGTLPHQSVGRIWVLLMMPVAATSLFIHTIRLRRPWSPPPLDEEGCKWRHLIANFFCKIKEFKPIAMRADNTGHSFEAVIQLAAAVINSR